MLAIKARNIIDKSNTEIKKVADGIVGELEEKDANSELSFREACNKIIHSEHIDFGIINFNPKDEVVHDGLTEFVYVYGSKGKQEWKATINLIQFSDKTMRILL